MAQRNWWEDDEEVSVGGPTLTERKTGADIVQSGASAESSSASAGKSKAETEVVQATAPFTVRKAKAEAIQAEKTAAKPVALDDNQMRIKGAKDRATVVRAQMLRLIRKFKSDIQGQPMSRGFGLFEQIDEDMGPIPAPPQFKSFTSAAQQMLPLIRPLVAQSAKEGDSNTEMTIFERYIPDAGDSDKEIVEKLEGLDMLIGGMAEGRPPSEVIQLGLKPRTVDEIERDLIRAVAPDADVTVVDGNTTTSSTPQGQSIKAPRLSPEATAEVQAYIRSPEFTPEGYAQLVSDKAVAEGHVKPEDRDRLYAANVEKARDFFSGMDTPEERTKGVGPGLDYSDADKTAQEQAGTLETLGTAFSNIPESGANLIQGLAALPADTISSALAGERLGAFKSTTDLAGELVQMAGGDPAGPTVQALADMLDERYGGLDNIKNTFATDPAGLAGDLSVFMTGGGTAAARAPGIVGKAGRALATAGKVIDPLSAGVAAAETSGRLAKLGASYLPDGLKAAPGAATRHVLGLSTGVPGGEPFGRAASAGFKRGRDGPNAQSTNFTANMRGKVDPTDVISQAEEAVRNMQQEASSAYRSGMVDTKNDASILSFDPIDKRLAGLRDRAFHGTQVKDKRAALVYEKMQTVVDEWRELDPEQYHTPEGMDALKQRIGDEIEDLNVNNERRAAGIAKGVYRQIRNDIADQVPTYAKTMRDYERASDELRQVRQTFSLKDGAAADTKLRKLQSILRNNASTSYGYRRTLVDLMERHSGKGLVDSLSGQALSSWQPRGLQSLVGGSLATGGIASVAGLTPALAIPAAVGVAAASPRAMGELSYGAGRTLGTGVGVGRDMMRGYNANPSAALALSRGGTYATELDELMRRNGAGPQEDDLLNWMPEGY